MDEDKGSNEADSHILHFYFTIYYFSVFFNKRRNTNNIRQKNSDKIFDQSVLFFLTVKDSKITEPKHLFK